MNSSARERFDELDAARVLGDITEEELREFETLKEAHDFEPDEDLDWIAATVEETYASTEPLSSELVGRLEEQIVEFTEPSRSVVAFPKNVIQWLAGPQLGWAMAACLALAILVVSTLPEKRFDPVAARADLLEETDVTQLAFGPTDEYPEVQGDVVWSDTRQEGYLMLTGLEANDASKSQYQLWIVDPDRDEVPVDGGVFDIRPGRKSMTIPIRAALYVERPVAFVITEEQPGGVVVSKQERVAAIAARS